MLTGYSEKTIKGVAASEVPEMSLLYACIDLNSHCEHVLAVPYMCRIDTKKRRAIANQCTTYLIQMCNMCSSNPWCCPLYVCY